MFSRKLWLLRRLLAVLLVYTLLRVAFWLWNFQSFAADSSGELLMAFVQGLRFDISAIILSHIPFILFCMAPERVWKGSLWQNLLLAYFALVNFFVLVINVTDIELVNITGKRMTADLFRLQGDIEQQFGSMVRTYWPMALVGTLVFILLVWSYRRDPWPTGVPMQWPKQIGAWLLFIFILGVGVRGGFQLKPLRPVHAFAAGSQNLGTLTLNTTFTVLKSKNAQQVTPLTYFSSWSEVLEQLGKPRDSSAWHGRFKGANVVIIILESFGTEYWGAFNEGKGYTPFLDDLIKQSLAFSASFANGRRSIEAVPSILVGIPSLAEEPFITSDYQANRIYGLPELLKTLSYRSSFYHAAPNGSMFFDSFTKRIGFDEYIGRDEYPYPDDDDGQWGTYDEPFLKFMAERLTQTASPFMATMFTLSSHHPYLIPEKYKSQFPEGPLAIHKSIGYTDFSLRQFFAVAEKQPWYNNTLFILTGDHTSLSADKRYQDAIGGYRVPLVFFKPGEKWQGVDPRRVVQHIDILPSVVDLLGGDMSALSLFGHSIFSAADQALVYDRTAAGLWLMDNELGVELNRATGKVECFVHANSWKRQKSENPACRRVQRKLQALEQYFNNGLLNNSWYPGR